jgi:hypothetical protein
MKGSIVMIDRSERRRRRKRIINKRIKLLNSIIDWSIVHPAIVNTVCSSKFSNNNEINRYVSAGASIKTNTRKGHSNYRRPGYFGPAKRYKTHDKRQIVDMEQQLLDYNNLEERIQENE